MIDSTGAMAIAPGHIFGRDQSINHRLIDTLDHSAKHRIECFMRHVIKLLQATNTVTRFRRRVSCGKGEKDIAGIIS
jgi:hypothetical protein